MGMETAIVVGFVVLISVAIDAIIYGLTRILPKRKPTDLKYLRWESGNISVGLPKYVLPFQYYGFMILFMAFEPIIVLMLLFSLFPGMEFYQFLLIAWIALLPALYFAYKLAYVAAERREIYG